MAPTGRREGTVPLSDHEQRLLEQMERALYAEDPKFATSLRGKDARSSFRRAIVVASLGFALGIVLLMTGLIMKVTAVAILGFVVMLTSAYFALTGYRRITSGARLGVVEGATVRGARKPPKARSQRPFMQRIEERWQRRRDEGR